MSDIEDEDNSGIGALAAYQLGRWSAESDAELDRTMTSLSRARRGASSEAEFVAANRALAKANRALLAENNKLRNELADYKRNYGSLRAWAEEAGPEIDRLRADLAISRHDHARLREWGNEIEPLLAQLRTQSG